MKEKNLTCKTIFFLTVSFLFFRYDCPGGVRAQFIKIQKHGGPYLHINHVAAFGKTLTKVSFTVDSSSSVFLGRNNDWGPQLALSEVSNTNTGYWHSDTEDYNPWIKFKMSEEHEVVSVEVTDRQDCCFERFKLVEVLVLGSGTVTSCGVKSYEENHVYKYEWFILKFIFN